MTTTFALLCERCGLSQSEAAAFLGVSPSSVDKMARGVRSTPAGLIDDLRELYARIEQAAEQGLDQIDRLVEEYGETTEPIELGLSYDDHEARSLGWPCVGAHAAVLGLVAARADIPIIIVPRGSTPATAAAADARESEV